MPQSTSNNCNVKKKDMATHSSEMPGGIDNIHLDFFSDFVLFFAMQICVVLDVINNVLTGQ